MDGYFQSTLAANTLQHHSKNNATTQVAKTITHFPPTNKDFNCTELHTLDGIYPLLHETFYETIALQFPTGTRVSIVSVKQQQALSRNDSHLFDSSDDESNSSGGTNPLGASFSMTPVNKSAALPIPIASSSRKQIGATLTTSSSSSSIGGGLQIVTSPQRLMTTTPSGNNVSPYLPQSPSFPSTPTSQPVINVQPAPQQQFASGSYMMSSSQELSMNNMHLSTTNDNLISPSSYNNSSSTVGSLSSMFGRSSSTHNVGSNSFTGKSIPSSASRSNNIMSTSVTSSNSSKPKNTLLKTNSAFVLRFLVHENLQKLISAKGTEDDYLFFNIGSSFIWVDAKNKSKEPLSRIIFLKSYPLCHDINETTRSEDHLDVIIGFSTGDIIWYDPLCSKYVRLNKGGSMVSSAVAMIKWIPGSDDLFIAIFKNGTVMIMDKERDDQSFNIPEPASWVDTQFQSFRPHKSQKYNPVSFWKMSKEGLTDIAFSPDNIHLAITGSDGQLRVIDYRNERLNDIYSGYYGKLTCVSWSPDGRYILTGGEDDLVTLWSFHEKKLVARCPGHKSWVTAVAFDSWRCDEQTYRFGSVGEDCSLILWDFSFSALQKPKHPRSVTTSSSPPAPKWPPPLPQPIISSIERKKSLKNHRLFRGFSSPDTSVVNGSTGSFSRFRKRSSKSQSVFTSTNDDFHEEEAHQQQQKHLPVLHPPLKKNQAPTLQPTCILPIHADPCISLQFRENSFVTSDRRGRIRIWGRPASV